MTKKKSSQSKSRSKKLAKSKPAIDPASASEEDSPAGPAIASPSQASVASSNHDFADELDPGTPRSAVEKLAVDPTSNDGAPSLHPLSNDEVPSDPPSRDEVPHYPLSEVLSHPPPQGEVPSLCGTEY